MEIIFMIHFITFKIYLIKIYITKYLFDTRIKMNLILITYFHFDS